MGKLVDGVWRTGWYDQDRESGAFERQESRFREWIAGDGSSRFAAEPDRYHLYVSLACPWAHRTLIVRVLKRLERIITVSVVDPVFREEDWAFTEDSGPDSLNGCANLRSLYLRVDPHFSGMVTVPTLWDKRTGTIVNNESSEIIRMFNSAFDAYTDPALDLYPPPLRQQIDEINALVYDNVNNGVYKAGFAATQHAYDRAIRALFETLDELECRLAHQRYLIGEQITEADWRLFTTLVRFDAVYHGHFKCNLRRLVDYPHLWAYTRELYQWPGVAQTVDFDHIKRHYYMSHDRLNPTRIVPLGPKLDFLEPHGRDRRA